MEYKSFKEFYPFYLSEHSNVISRRLHFIGTSGVIALILLFFFTGSFGLLALLPVIGYGFAWAGHMLFEKNRPATFKHPFYSLAGDFVMFFQILTGKIKIF